MSKLKLTPKYKFHYLLDRQVSTAWVMVKATKVKRINPSNGCPKKLYLILRLNSGAIHFSMTKLLALLDCRDMYRSFGT